MVNRCLAGDCRDSMRRLVADGVRVQCAVTSPPYWGLRDYGVTGQLGLEPTIAEYIANMVEVFRLVRELLADDGVLWLNMGDSYAGGGRGGNPADSPFRKQATNVGSLVAPSPVPDGLKPKDMCGIPWRLAFALQADGWWLRQDIVWSKPNPMPESVTDRCTKAHEYPFLLTKRERYYYDAEAIAEPSSGWNGSRFDDGKNEIVHSNVGRNRKPVGSETRNKRSVWTVATQPYSEAHFATFPPALIEPCILAGSRSGDVVFDPFLGSGTVAKVAQRLGRQWLGCELNPDYVQMQKKRTAQAAMTL